MGLFILRQFFAIGMCPLNGLMLLRILLLVCVFSEDGGLKIAPLRGASDFIMIFLSLFALTEGLSCWYSNL